MSLVGPRPAVPQEVEQYQRWQRRRLRMRPGSNMPLGGERTRYAGFRNWMRLDMEYIDNWSLALDWKIMLADDTAGAYRPRGALIQDFSCILFRPMKK